MKKNVKFTLGKIISLIVMIALGIGMGIAIHGTFDQYLTFILALIITWAFWMLIIEKNRRLKNLYLPFSSSKAYRKRKSVLYYLKVFLICAGLSILFLLVIDEKLLFLNILVTAVIMMGGFFLIKWVYRHVNDDLKIIDAMTNGRGVKPFIFVFIAIILVIFLFVALH